MGKNIIVSEDTIRDLLEAHASLSAWYYELWSALRVAKASASAPDDAARAAFVERMAASFPEVASIARSIQVPRMFVPPPPAVSIPPVATPEAVEEAPTAIEPAPARLRELHGQPPKSQPGIESPAPASSQPAIAPPPLVVPSTVKYEP
ncbi:uncharacterized protein SOCE26_086370 [Sorangium cellulosum]|uniref:Uncharacterized protein n=1 Tax=Sorangium cellulosum TaxID=56 RepID=A0A2L0F6C7_SORCE|nr:hypothetical protein [Sorangium cellulosum]AUX47125.1 uncharacterized protein SOCE26_086370 [Sorangium cellulosum]